MKPAGVTVPKQRLVKDEELLLLEILFEFAVKYAAIGFVAQFVVPSHC